jgi:hypothetical protein
MSPCWIEVGGGVASRDHAFTLGVIEIRLDKRFSARLRTFFPKSRPQCGGSIRVPAASMVGRFGT